MRAIGSETDSQAPRSTLLISEPRTPWDTRTKTAGRVPWGYCFGLGRIFFNRTLKFAFIKLLFWPSSHAQKGASLYAHVCVVEREECSIAMILKHLSVHKHPLHHLILASPPSLPGGRVFPFTTEDDTADVNVSVQGEQLLKLQ